MKALVLTLTALGAGLRPGLPARADPPIPGVQPALYVCSGGEMQNRLAPVLVSVRVDQAGGVKLAWATWSLGGTDVLHAPFVQFDYRLKGDTPGRWPDGVRVSAVAALDPVPKATAARIVLTVNGVEKASRPWTMFSKARAAIVAAPRRSTVYFGTVPFYPNPANPADAGLVEVLHAAGDPDAKLGVQVIGDDGSVMSSATYPIDQPAVRAKAKVDAALAQAMERAKTPTQCKKQAG